MNRKLLSTLVVAAILAAFPLVKKGEAQAPFATCQFTINSGGVSNSSPAGVCNIDPQRMSQGAGVSLLLTMSNGANLTTTVQVTGDSPVNTTGGGNWNNHDTLINETSSANGNIQFPVIAVRLNTTSYVSGTATLTVIQPALPHS